MWAIPFLLQGCFFTSKAKLVCQSSPQQHTGTRKCHWCGREDHDPRNCRFKSYECRNCSKKGTLTSHVQKQRYYMILGTEEEKWEREERDKEEEESDTCAQKLEALGIFHNRNKGQRGMAPCTATTEVDNIHLEMETDTGSAKSIMGKDTFSRFFSEKQLNTKAPVLTTYSGEELPMKGTIEVTVKHNQQTHQLGLSVADVTGQPPILGREWLSQVKIDWPHVPHVSKTRQLGEVLAKHEPVFENGLGTMKQFKAKLHLKPHFLPKFIKARPVPFAVCPKVEAELEQLEKDGEPEFRVTQDQANADMLSQLPLEGDETATEELVFHTTVLEEPSCHSWADCRADQEGSCPLRGVDQYSQRVAKPCQQHRTSALLQMETRALSWGRCDSVVSSHGHSHTAETKDPQWTTWRAPGNVQDEGCHHELCLVAWHQPRHTNNSQAMPGLHQSGQYTSHSTIAPVVKAKTTLAACARRQTSQNIKGSISLSWLMPTQSGWKWFPWKAPSLTRPLTFSEVSLLLMDCRKK